MREQFVAGEGKFLVEVGAVESSSASKWLCVVSLCPTPAHQREHARNDWPAGGKAANSWKLSNARSGDQIWASTWQAARGKLGADENSDLMRGRPSAYKPWAVRPTAAVVDVCV